MITNLQKVVRDLLVNIYLVLKVMTQLQRLHLIVNGLLIVLKTLKVCGYQLEYFNLSGEVNIA